MDGVFNQSETMDLITKMIHLKIKHHESKIEKDITEEDLKHREARIKQLQKDLYELKYYIEHKKDTLSIHATITVN